MKLHDKPIKGFTDEAIAYMQAYGWPGNVRELENEVQRMLVLADGDSLGKELLSAPICASGLRGGEYCVRVLSPVAASRRGLRGWRRISYRKC